MAVFLLGLQGLTAPSITVVVPFHRSLAQLSASVSAIRRSVPDAELIIAADGAIEDCGPIAREFSATVIVVPGPSGPAVARNRAAAKASGEILVFVDSDVVVTPEAIPGMRALLAAEPGLAGVFGAYDHEPAAPNFMSQFKNLSHTYVHEVGSPNAKTFWAGLGAVRADVFRAVGGFDERFSRPWVEDIDLGYRITQAGGSLRLDPTFRAKHLKHWTLVSCIVTDVRTRGVPWVQLIHRYQALANDLNTSTALRLSVAVSYLSVLSLILALLFPWLLLATSGLTALLVLLNFDYYRWFLRRRGWSFATRVVPVHMVHHLCNGVSFVVGTALHFAGQRGVRFSWTLPAPLTPVSLQARIAFSPRQTGPARDAGPSRARR